MKNSTLAVKILRRYRIYVGSAIAGACAAIASPFVGGLGDPGALTILERGPEGYVLYSILSLTGVRESGVDRDGDGRYDFWSVITESDPRYSELPLCFEAWSGDGDATPDFCRVWLGREGNVGQDVKLYPLFGYLQETRVTEGQEEVSRIEVFLGDRSNPQRYFRYYDIDQDGRIDVRRIVEKDVVKESFVYFEDTWARVLSPDKPFIRIDSGGRLLSVIFSDGQWMVAESLSK